MKERSFMTTAILSHFVRSQGFANYLRVLVAIRKRSR